VRTGHEHDSGCSDEHLDYGHVPDEVHSSLKSDISKTQSVCPTQVSETAKNYVRDALHGIEKRVNNCVGKFGRKKCPKLVGWKERTLLQLIPEFARLHISGSIKVKVLHLVRDGRDIATSNNQHEERELARVLLSHSRQSQNTEEDNDDAENSISVSGMMRSMSVWSKLNTQVNQCAQSLKLPYMFLRIEDLVTSNVTLREQTIKSVHIFLGVEPNVSMTTLSEVFTTPMDIGNHNGGVQSEYGSRWKGLSNSTLASLALVGSEANALFRYNDLK